MSEITQDSPGTMDRLVFATGFLLLLAVFTWQFIQPEPEVIPVTPRLAELAEAAEPFPFEPAPGGRFSLDDLKYFNAIAFGSEHEEVPPLIRKWTGDLIIRVEGSPTQEDREAVRTIMQELNSLQEEVTLREDFFGANVVIRFQPESTFHERTQRYRPTNLGFFWVRWIDEEIYAGNVLIDSSTTTQAERNALVTEELTQVMGLMNDSALHEESIFNDTGSKLVPGLAPIDRQLVRMLYHPGVKPSMTPDEALPVLAGAMREELQE